MEKLKDKPVKEELELKGTSCIIIIQILAIRTKDGIKMNIRKYSRTTSKLQTKIRCYCNVIEEFEGDDATIYYWGW